MSDITQQQIANLSPEKLQNLADRLLAKRQVAVQDERIPVQPRPAAIPLSYSQEGLWLLDRLGGGASYNETMALRIEGALDVSALERSLGEIIRRHETLRTRIVTSEGGVGEQVIDPPHDFRLDVIDLSSRESRNGLEPEAAALQNMEPLRQPFRLAEEPLLRVRLLRLSADEHILAIAVHHIIWDLTSFGILMRELNILYASFAAGRPSPLPPLEAQYADYAIWQRERLKGAAFEKQREYWKRQLEGAPPALDLPTDRPRRTDPTFEGAHVWFTITEKTVAALKELSVSEGATLHMILLAAFEVLLSRWSGQQDLVVGTPVLGRSRKPADQMIGYFVNLQASRADLSGDPTFRQYLGRVRETALEAMANQDIPFDRVVAELQAERDSARHALFQVAFAVHSQAPGRGAPGATPLPMTPLKLRNETSKFDLHMEIFDRPDGVTGKIEYATDLFDADRIDRLAKNFASLLGAIVADPDQSISRYALMSDAERRQVVEEWNETRTAFPSDRCMQQLFEEQAAASPAAVAVVCNGEAISYGELNARGNRLAHHLIGQGVGPDVLVGLFMERSPDVIVAMLAILKAGGAYLPIDPSYPDDRIRYVLDDARVAVVLTQERLRARWSSIGATTRTLSVDACDVSACPDQNPPVTATSSNLAYVIYTSGSTGGPKGAAVTHAAVNRLVRDTNYIDILPTDNIAQISNNSFDAATFEIWGALLNGARVTIIPKNEALSPAELAQQLRRSSITTLFVTTALFNQYVRQVPDIFAPLRHVLFGGEACDPAAVRAVLDHGKPAQLLHVYGPTESTTFASYFPVTSVSGGATTVPIGRPLSNTTIYVVDEWLEPVPVGVVGELCIGGDGLARGYLGRPALTAEKFVPNPFGRGTRLYRTGDRVRLRPDGAIEFVGRIDDQVKIRGFRIELGEIEAVLLRHDAVRECAVVPREEGGRRQLVAYIVARGAVDHAALRAHVMQSLPDYMVPAAFVTLERLPLNPNGKLDRAALPSPDFREQAESGYVAPRTSAEERLAKVMAAVLKLDRVGVTDNFFDVGGDSIIAIQVIAHAKEAGLLIRLADLFQQQTVANIAAVAKESKASRAKKEESGEGPVPLTPIQRKVMALMGESFALNVPVTVWECEGIEAAPLARALRELVMQHDALRLGVRKTAAGFEQWNAGAKGMENLALVTEVDLAHLRTSEERMAALQETAQRLASAIDLASPPILRAALIDFGAGSSQRLLLAIHHLALDPVSLPIVMEDLQRFYAAARDGREIPRSPKATSYKVWAEKIAAYAASPAIEGAAEFWRSRPWSECKPLPRDHEDAAAEPMPRIAAVSLDENETEALLKSAQRQHGMQVDELLLAAAAEAVAQWTGSRTVLIDLMHHGRVDLFKDVDISRTVGWFSTEVPLVLDLGNGGIDGAVAAVRRELQSMPDHGLGFGVLRYMNGDPVLCAAPAPEIRLNHLGRMAGGGNSDALFRSRFHELPAQAASRLDRLVEVRTILNGESLQAQWLYDAAVHDATTIRAVAGSFVHNLRALVATALAIS